MGRQAGLEPVWRESQETDTVYVDGHTRSFAFRCDGCERLTPLCVEVRSHSDEEYGPCKYCPTCVRRMYRVVFCKGY